MRIDSIIAISANPQQSPQTKSFDSVSIDKKTSGTSFQDHLRAKLQQPSNPTETRQAEDQLAGLLVGYLSNLRVTNKIETKVKVNAG